VPLTLTWYRNTFDQGMTYTDFTPPGGTTTIADLQTWADANVKSASGSWSTTNHKRILLGAGNTYTGSVGFQIAGYSNTTFEGGGAETAYGHTGGAIIQVTGGTITNTNSSPFRSADAAATPGSDIRWHGLTVLGQSTDYATSTAGDTGEFQMGFCLFGVASALVDHCISDKCKGDGLFLSDRLGGSGTRCSDITMRYSTVKNNGRMGVALVAADRVNVSDCTFTDIAYCPFDIEPDASGQGATDVTFDRNVISGKWSWDASFDDSMFHIIGVSGSTVSGYVRFRDNVVTGETATGGSPRFLHFHEGLISKSGELTVTGNTCSGTQKSSPAMYLQDYTTGPITITGNTGFLTSGSWVSDLGGNATITQSGNS
jgi:hypothetical protein